MRTRERPIPSPLRSPRCDRAGLVLRAVGGRAPRRATGLGRFRGTARRRGAGARSPRGDRVRTGSPRLSGAGVDGSPERGDGRRRGLPCLAVQLGETHGREVRSRPLAAIWGGDATGAEDASPGDDRRAVYRQTPRHRVQALRAAPVALPSVSPRPGAVRVGIRGLAASASAGGRNEQVCRAHLRARRGVAEAERTRSPGG